MPALDVATALDLLGEGDLEIVGRLIASTNNALLCTIARRCPDPEPDLVATCVYKPTIGERPLDDFPDGSLAHREVAAFEVSRASGWDIVPPTVLRDGPFGEGMVQLCIEVDEEVDPVGLVVTDDERLRPMAVFDVAVNNTDRKAGHLLPVPGGRIYGVDHGVCFSPCPSCGPCSGPGGERHSGTGSATCSATCEPGSKVSSAIGSARSSSPARSRPRRAASTACWPQACSPIRILGGRRCPGHRSERTGSGLVVGRALLAEEGELVGVAGPAFAAGVDG